MAFRILINQLHWRVSLSIPCHGWTSYCAVQCPTPLGTTSRVWDEYPRHQGGSVGDYLTAPLGKISFMSLKSYVGGSKALDSLVKLIASTEAFSILRTPAAWTADVCLTSRISR